MNIIYNAGMDTVEFKDILQVITKIRKLTSEVMWLFFDGLEVEVGYKSKVDRRLVAGTPVDYNKLDLIREDIIAKIKEIAELEVEFQRMVANYELLGTESPERIESMVDAIVGNQKLIKSYLGHIKEDIKAVGDCEMKRWFVSEEGSRLSVWVSFQKMCNRFIEEMGEFLGKIQG